MLDLGSAVGYLLLDTTGFTSGFATAQKSMKTFLDRTNSLKDRLSGLGSAMSSAGGTLTKTLTLPLVGVGTALGSFSLSFEDAMAKVGTIADTSQVPLENLESAILDLSDKTGIAATDIAQNVYDAISAGQKTGDAVAFVEQATKLATAGFTSSASSLDVLTTALNAYGLESNQAAHISDVLITTQNLGKTTVDELASSMGKVIPIANANGTSIEELGTAYSILTANGIATAESGTYLKSMLNELGKSSDGAGLKLKELTGKSFKELMSEGASLGDVLEILNEDAISTGIGLNEMFGSVEAGSAALTISGKGAKAYNDTLRQMVDSAGATEVAYEKMQTTSWSLRKAFNEIKNVAIDFGNVLMDTLAPAIQGMVDKVSSFTEWFRNLDDSVKQTIIKIGLAAAAVGPLLIAGGKLTIGISKIIGLLSGAGGLAGILGALSGPIGIVIAASAALAAAWANDFGGIREKTASIMESIKSLIDSAMKAIKWVWEEDLGGLRTAAETAWNLIKDIFVTVLDLITDTLDVFAKLFEGDWKGLWESVKKLAVNIWNNIKKIFVDLGKYLLNTLLSWLRPLIDAAKKVFGGIYNGFKEVWTTITSWFKRAINDPVGTVKSIGSALFDAGKSIFTSLWDGLKSVWNSITSWVSDSIDWLVSKVKFWEKESDKVGKNSSVKTRSVDGSHANGLDYVPRDGYVAELHEGERVLTREENKAYGKATQAKLQMYVTFTQPIDQTTAKKVSKQLAKETEEELRGKGLVLV